jgi:hypothetical protein
MSLNLAVCIGRFDLDLIAGYKCKNCLNVCPNDLTVKKAVASGFWPGTPISYSQLFSQDLFEYWDIMQKRMPGVSERSFVLGLQDFSSNKNRVNHFIPKYIFSKTVFLYL